MCEEAESKKKKFQSLQAATQRKAAINRPIRFFHDVGLALFSRKPTEGG